ncbi:MAG: hypothetical protein ACLQLH_14875 [Terracidiphilus sp.]
MKVRSHAVIDTNVLLVANEQHENISPEGVIACIERLELLRKSGCVVLDDGYEILREYRQKTKPNTGNRFGDGFLKWLLQNIGNTQFVTQVHIEKHAGRGYVEFPDDAGLSEFDLEDRKFVAVAVAHPRRPPILQGSDSKWIDWSERLNAHGITVEFLCVEDMKRFIQRKRASRT